MSLKVSSSNSTGPPCPPEHLGQVAPTLGTRDTHTGTPGGSAVPREQPHTREGPGPGTHTAGAGDKEGRKHPQNPTSHPGAWFGTHSSCCWSLWGCAGQKAPSTPGAWLWGQSGFPGEHLLLSVFSPRHHGGCDALSKPRRMCQHQRELVQRS